MKLALAFVFVAASIAVASAALTCYTDESKCDEDHCCVKVGVGFSVIGKCMKKPQLDEMCQMHQAKSLVKSHVYIAKCPCLEGLKCVAKDGMIGKVMGTCQVDDSFER